MSIPTPEPSKPEPTENPGTPEPALSLPDSRTWARRTQPDSSPRPHSIWLRRILLTAAAVAVLLAITLILTTITLRHDLRASLPSHEGLLDGSVAIAGLTAPVTITRNAQGVPSIHATNLDDLLIAQGYVTASDRLFQMDALRRHAAGTLAEILGPNLLQHDREQRILQLRAAADRATAALPPDQLHQLQAYANGVNAFINTHNGTTHSAHKRSPSAQDLPIEFHLLHYTPALWQPRDSLLIALVMAQDLSTDFPTKLNREALSAHLPAALLADLYPTGSWRDRPPTQDAPNLTTPTAPILQIPLDNTQSSCADGECSLVPAPANHPTLAVRAGLPHLRDGSIVAKVGGTIPNPPGPSPQDLLRIYTDLRANPCNGCRDGSNNWAIAGVHTASGAPLLSNDMHLGLTAPDIWYEAALHVTPTTDAASTPAVRAGLRAGLDVEGFTLPGIPFVIVGRNPYVAWGFTNSGADVQDVLIEHLRGAGAHTEYERPDHTWAPVGHHTEVIHVRASHDVTLDVLTTTATIGSATLQTPIITPLYPTEHRALALAWNIYDPTTLTSPFLAIDTATDAASLVAAAAGFGSASQNMIYADAHHIGYHLLGRIPIRGPAIEHPLPTEPPTLPNPIPTEDEEDESGNPAAALVTPPIPSSRPEHPLTSVISTGAQPNLVLSTGAQHNLVLSTGAQHNLVISTRAQHNLVISTGAQRSGETPVLLFASATQNPPQQQQLPTQPPAGYTIGSPLSPVPVDALDPTQIWSGYIPYDQLPSVLDPTSGIVATANARITPDNYPYQITLNWADPYRVERIHHLLEAAIASGHPLTPADMLRIQTDTHSEYDLLVAQRLAYALDHSALTKKDPRLQQAANLLRDWNGDVSLHSTAAAITAAVEPQLWLMLLTPQIRAYDQAHHRLKPSPSAQDIAHIIDLYTWDESRTALEQVLQNTPVRWLPSTFANWNDFLTTAVERGLRAANAPRNLTTFTYGPRHPIEIAHPIFGSHSPISTLLGAATGTGLHPNSGDYTTIKAAGPHFGPSERFTADLSNPDDTQANITTGESGNPASPWFLDQFQPWLQGATFTLPLNHPTVQHTLTLTPR